MISFLIHPKYRDTGHQDYLKSQILTWIYVILLTAWIPYYLYFILLHPEDTLKILNESIWGIMFLAAVLTSRFANNLNYGFTMILFISYVSMGISAFYTGGIYSVDLLWLIFCLVIHCIFINYRWAVFSAVLVCMYIYSLYYIENHLGLKDNFFKNYLITHNSDNQAFSMILFVIVLVSSTTVFVKKFIKTSKALLKLSHQKVQDLEILLEQKTNELSIVRSENAKLFYDEMGNKLASINILSQSIGMKIQSKQNENEIIKLLEIIEQRSKELYEGTKDFIWAVDLKSDYVNEIYTYVQKFAESYLGLADIDLHAEYQNQINGNGRLNVAEGRLVVFICKELIMNAAQHSGCTEVHLQVEEQEHKVIIVIADNGTGFNEDKINKKGLNKITGIVKKINGKLILQSTEQGTSVSMIFNLQISNLDIE